MLAIILGVLKIIGIILLILLGLILLILGIVLFVPIRYKGNGQINDIVKEAHLKVTWLLHAVHVQVNYNHPDKPETIIKVLGINIEKFKKKKKDDVPKPEPKEKEEKPKKEKKKKEKQPRYDINMALLSDYEEEAPENTESSKTDSATLASENIPSEEPVSENIKRMVEQAQALQKETWRDKLEKKVNKVKDILFNIKYYMDILQEDDTKAMIKVTLDALLDILKKLRPRKLIAHIQFGFETPDKTGKLYGLYWMFKPALGKDVEIVPNFEDKILEGDLFFKGRLTIFTVLVNALKVILDKRFKPLINKFKNGGLKNGRENE